MDFQQESQNKQKVKRFHWTNANRSPNEEAELREYTPQVPVWNLYDKQELKTNVYNVSLELQSQTQLVIIDRILHRINEVDEAQPIDSNCSVSDQYFYDSPTHHVLCWTSLSKKPNITNNNNDKKSNTNSDQQNQPIKSESGLFKSFDSTRHNEDSLSKSSDYKNNNSNNNNNKNAPDAMLLNETSNLNNENNFYIPKYDYENDKPEDIRRMANTNFDYKRYVEEHKAKNQTLPLKQNEPNYFKLSSDSSTKNKETFNLQSVTEKQNKTTENKLKDTKSSPTKEQLDADKDDDKNQIKELLRRPSSQLSDQMRDSLLKLHKNLLDENKKSEKNKQTEPTNKTNKNENKQSKVPEDRPIPTKAAPTNDQKMSQNDEKSYSEQSNELLHEIKEKRPSKAKLNNENNDAFIESDEKDKKNKTDSTRKNSLPKANEADKKNAKFISTNNQPKNDYSNSRVSISYPSFDEKDLNMKQIYSSTNSQENNKENFVPSPFDLNSNKENEEKNISKTLGKSQQRGSKFVKTISESNQSDNESPESGMKQTIHSIQLNRTAVDQTGHFNDQLAIDQEKKITAEQGKSSSPEKEQVLKDSQDLPPIVNNSQNEKKSERPEKLLAINISSSSRAMEKVSNERKRESTLEKSNKESEEFLDKLNSVEKISFANQRGSNEPTKTKNSQEQDNELKFAEHEDAVPKQTVKKQSSNRLKQDIEEEAVFNGGQEKENKTENFKGPIAQVLVRTSSNGSNQKKNNMNFKQAEKELDQNLKNKSESEPKDSVRNGPNSDEQTILLVSSKSINKRTAPQAPSLSNNQMNHTSNVERRASNSSSSSNFEDAKNLPQKESKRISNQSLVKEVQESQSISSKRTESISLSKISSSTKPLAPVKTAKIFKQLNDLPITNQIFLREESEENDEHLETITSNKSTRNSTENDSLNDATFSEKHFRSIYTQTHPTSSSSSQLGSLKSSSPLEIIRLSSFEKKMESKQEQETQPIEPQRRKVKQNQHSQSKTEDNVPRKPSSSSRVQSQPSFSLQADSILQELKKITDSRENVNISSNWLSQSNQDLEKHQNGPFYRLSQTIALDERKSRVKSPEKSSSFILNKQKKDENENTENQTEVAKTPITPIQPPFKLPVKARNRQIEQLLITNRLVKADSIEYNIPTNRTITRKSKQNELKEEEPKYKEKNDSSATADSFDSEFRRELGMLQQERDETRASIDEGYNESNRKDLAQIDSIVIDDMSIETHFDTESQSKLISKSSDDFLEKPKRQEEELQDLEYLEKTDEKLSISSIEKSEVKSKQTSGELSRRDSLLLDQILNPKLNSNRRDDESDDEGVEGMFYKEPPSTSRSANSAQMIAHEKEPSNGEKENEHLNKKLISDVNVFLENLKKERERIKKTDSLSLIETKQSEQLQHGSPKQTASEKNFRQGYMENASILHNKEHRSPSFPQTEDLNFNSSSTKKEIDENKRRFLFLKRNSSNNLPKDKRPSSQRLISLFK